MEIVTALSTVAPEPRVVAIGTFDGVHAGHRAVIREAVSLARRDDLRSAVLTFDRHPLTIVDARHAPRLLTSMTEKTRQIEALGPDELIVLPFDREFAAMSAQRFCADLLEARLHARTVVVGDNFRFGAGGAGDTATLRTCGAGRGFETVVVPLVTERGATISSTRIRRLLHSGELEEVREILGRPPSAAGRVVHGVKRGRALLGVPTANVDVEAGVIFPGRGVYAGRALVDGAWYRTAVNIGHNPTFRGREEDTTHVTIEAFLIGFDGDIYEHSIRVDFIHKIRDERRFESPAELVAQMHRDIDATAALADPAFDEVGLPAAHA